MQRLVSLSHTLSFFTFPCRVRPTGKDFVTKLTCLKTDKKSPAAGCAAWQETRCPKGIWGRLAPGASLAPAAGSCRAVAAAMLLRVVHGTGQRVHCARACGGRAVAPACAFRFGHCIWQRWQGGISRQPRAVCHQWCGARLATPCRFVHGLQGRCV